MIWIKKHWYLIVIVAAFALGFLVSGGQKVRNKDYEKEVKVYKQLIQDKQIRIDQLNKDRQTIIERMGKDKAHYDSLYNRQQISIQKLKKIIANVDFKNFTNDQLDSVRAALYGSGPLHTDQ